MMFGSATLVERRLGRSRLLICSDCTQVHGIRCRVNRERCSLRR
jgi:hypothetical protein